MLYYADQAPLQDSDSEDEFDDEESESDSEDGKLWPSISKVCSYDWCNFFFFNIGLTMADIIMGQMMFGGGRMPMSPPGRGRHGCYCWGFHAIFVILIKVKKPPKIEIRYPEKIKSEYKSAILII